MQTEAATNYRALAILILAQALAGTASPIVISLAASIGYNLAWDNRFATLPVGLFSIGVAMASLPFSGIMAVYGRKMAFIGGACFTILGGLIVSYGIFLSSFTLLCLGSWCLGLSHGVAYFYRFAATDFSSKKDKPRVISWVLIGGVVSAIIGPQVVFWFRGAFDHYPGLAPFGIVAFLGLPILFLLSFLTFPAPHIAQDKIKRPLRVIARHPPIYIAIIGAAIASGLMSLIMTATPVTMEHHYNHSEENAALAIQWHILAMYLPSLFTGSLIARFGVLPILSAGMVLLSAAAVIPWFGTDVGHFWVGLILLGLGWNFGFIGGTSLLAQSYRHDEKNRVEGINDFIVFSMTAICSLGSGLLLVWLGWEMLNFAVFPLTGGVLMILWLKRRSLLTAEV